MRKIYLEDVDSFVQDMFSESYKEVFSSLNLSIFNLLKLMKGIIVALDQLTPLVALF